MDNGAGLLENWAEDLADAEAKLRVLLDDICEVRQEVSGAAALARQFMILATIDDVFLRELFTQADPAMIIVALEECDDGTRNTFIEAALYLQKKFER